MDDDNKRGTHGRRTFVRTAEDPRMVKSAYASNITTYRKNPKNTQFGSAKKYGKIDTRETKQSFYFN